MIAFVARPPRAPDEGVVDIDCDDRVAGIGDRVGAREDCLEAGYRVCASAVAVPLRHDGPGEVSVLSMVTSVNGRLPILASEKLRPGIEPDGGLNVIDGNHCVNSGCAVGRVRNALAERVSGRLWRGSLLATWLTYRQPVHFLLASGRVTKVTCTVCRRQAS
jgi:hypothetical protein